MAQKQLKNFGFMQYLEPEYWNWSDMEKSTYMTDSYTIMQHICQRLHNGLVAAGASDDELQFKFSGIEHNKDTLVLWDPDKQMDMIEQKKEHIHGFIELVKKRDMNVIADWIGLEKQYIEIPKGRYGRENMLAYLIHAKDPSKYLYNPKEVQTYDTWSYMRYYQEKHTAWEEYKATASLKHNNTKVDWLVKQVQLGKLTMTDIMENETYKMIYANNMRLIKDAQQFLNEERAYRTIKALENEEFVLSVHFITGAPGAGKSFFANKMCKDLENKHDWRTYEASGCNPMDKYSGEEILLLDDLRSSSMGATDWLKMLDHLSKSAISARYNNKGRAYRTIIMTAYEDPYSYFSYMKGSGGTDEALAQFIRRLQYTVTIHRLNDGERIAKIEEIGQGEPKVYNLLTKEFVQSGRYAQRSEMPYIKSTNFYGVPIALLSFDDAINYLSNEVTEMNNPDNDHSNTERKTVNEIVQEKPFINKTNLVLEEKDLL